MGWSFARKRRRRKRDADFDGLAPEFEQMYDSSWGQVRLGVLLNDLLEHVPQLREGGLRVLDAGGGGGRVAIELARLGNEVVLCDPSRRMLDRAESAIAEAGLTDRITVVHAPLQDVHVEPEGRFDVITCHAVIEWLADPKEALAHITELLSPGGHLSLMFTNRRAMALKGRPRGGLHEKVVLGWLAGNGLTVESRSGIRILHDHLPDTLRTPERVDDLVEIESALRGTEPFASLGQHLHLVCRRADAEQEGARAPRTALLALAALVALGFAGYGLLSTFVNAPRVFGDEVIYMDAADSLADGHGLRVQDASYQREPGYPAVIAPVFVASQNRALAYRWIKLVNAFVFVLAAVPIYLLARRLLPRRTSAIVAAFSIAIPSSVYIGLVMTESLAYLASSVALLAIVLAVERPAPLRQLGALASVGAAYLVRPQFAALLPAFLLALGLAAALTPERRSRRRLRELWPTAAGLLAVAVAVVTVGTLSGRNALGDYSFLWRSYNVAGVARWSDYHAADLALYLGLVPVVLLPCILVALHRSRSDVARPFLAVFCAVNLVAILVAGAFSSTPYAQGRVYDRYVFFVVPLWLVAGAAWLRAGAPRPRRAAALGLALVLALLAVFPVDTFVVADASKELHAAGTPLWVHLDSLANVPGLSAHRLVALFAVAAAGFAFLVPRRRAWLLVVPVAAVFAANSAFLWRHNIDDWNQARAVFGSNLTGVRWIDDVVPDDQTVALLAVGGRPACTDRLSYAYAFSEFFNDRVDAEARVALPSYGDIPSVSVRVGRNGRLAGATRGSVTAHWWVVPDGVPVNGRLVARGTRERLALWHTDGPLTFHARSNRQLQDKACRSQQQHAA